MVEMSLWPFLSSFGFLGLLVGGVIYWHYGKIILTMLSFFLLTIVSFFWWKDVSLEGFVGYHKINVYVGLQMGMLFFILSEVLFFFSFFWSYFQGCWAIVEELGFIWPPISFKKMIMDPLSMPLLKTVLLLSSGVSLTMCHKMLMKQKICFSLMSLFLTYLFGFYFMFLQVQEYSLSFFSLKSFFYGTVFFLLTGFHGMHVTMGAVFLLVCFFRLLVLDYKKHKHVGFECAAWYWHFVDVVWIFLFFFLYWYGYK